MSGAHEVDVLHDMLQDIGFVDVNIRIKEESREYISQWMENAEEYVVAAEVTARKPGSWTYALSRALSRVGKLAYAAWLAQAKHHAAHCDTDASEEPECCTASPISCAPKPSKSC